jgi:transcriptional regulator with XRE-family HTH domain
MTFEEFIEEEKARDPEFRREWEEGEPEFEIIRTLVGARSRLGWTQKELARRMGTDQPTISRAETTGQVTPDFMARFALAVGGDATLSVKLPGRARLTFRLAPTMTMAGPCDPPPAESTAGTRKRVTFRLVSPRTEPASEPSRAGSSPSPCRAEEDAGGPAFH